MQGRHAEAEGVLAEALERVERALPREHLLRGMTIRTVGLCLTAQERYEEAEASLLEAHEILVTVVGDDHPQTSAAVADLVALYERRGKPDEAAEWRARLPGP